MQTIKMRLANLLWLSITIFILSVIAGATIHIFAAFTEPTAAPSASDQDFAQNILGANNTDNDFDSSSVAASSTGSIIERLEYINDKMYQIQDWPGRGWVASSSGNASVALTREACDAASGWEWFEDGNGNGDYIDPEDGICVQTAAVSSGVLCWNGEDNASDIDNSYIAAYTCSGYFPNGTVASYSGINSGGLADNTWNDGDCALCQADCYDGRKDLPDQGGYTAPDATCTSNEACYEGPITPEVLKNWKGTRLPTSQDFYGFCGYKDGGSDYETGCSSDTTLGDYGQMVGRTDECLDLSDSGSYEWFSDQYFYRYARVAGVNACSFVFSILVTDSNRFRAVFRP